MLLRLSTLATGRTGVRPETAQAYAALLDAGHHAGRPRVRLARLLRRPRAARRTCALALMGEGEVRDARRRRCARPPRRCRAPGIEPVAAGREGGPGADQRHRRHARHAACSRCADLRRAADDRRRRRGDERRGAARHRRRLRRRPAGAAPAPRARPTSAANLRALLAGSGDHGQPPRPGVHPRAGRLLAALRPAGARRGPRHRSPTPRRSPTASWPPPSTTRSSPLDGRVESNGNFHGAPVGYVLDFLAIAVADVAGMSERRTDRFLDVARSHGLPPFLADDPGVDSGHMIAQYTAGRDRLRAQAAGRARPASTRSRRRRCRRTTSRWAGTPPASCAARSTA